MINSKLQHPPPYNPLAFWPWGAEFEPTNLEKFKHPVYCLRVEVGDSVRNLNPWPPIWLVSSVGSALHQCCRGHESKSHTDLNFFRPYLHYCLSNVHYCDDCFYIHFFVCSSHMIFHMFTVNSNTSMECSHFRCGLWGFYCILLVFFMWWSQLSTCHLYPVVLCCDWMEFQGCDRYIFQTSFPLWSASNK